MYASDGGFSMCDAMLEDNVLEEDRTRPPHLTEETSPSRGQRRTTPVA